MLVFLLELDATGPTDEADLRIHSSELFVSSGAALEDEALKQFELEGNGCAVGEGTRGMLRYC